MFPGGTYRDSTGPADEFCAPLVYLLQGTGGNGRGFTPIRRGRSANLAECSSKYTLGLLKAPIRRLHHAARGGSQVILYLLAAFRAEQAACTNSKRHPIIPIGSWRAERVLELGFL